MAWPANLLQRALRFLQLGLDPVALVHGLLDESVAFGPLGVRDVGLWPGKRFQSALELGEDRLGCVKVFAGGQFAASGEPRLSACRGLSARLPPARSAWRSSDQRSQTRTEACCTAPRAWLSSLVKSCSSDSSSCCFSWRSDPSLSSASPACSSTTAHGWDRGVACRT